MVDVNTKVAPPAAFVTRNQAKMARLREINQRPGVRVEPANEDMRRLLKHPKAGGFRSEGSLEWPNDTFTQRRLRDGDIKLEEQKAAPAPRGSRGES